MLYGLLLCLYFLNCILLILIVLLQKTKSSLGFGALGGGAQTLFGGGGGQDLFQKVTWGLGACFMAGSLGLALMKSRQSKEFQYIKSNNIATASRDTMQKGA
jgi:protein translocase SecG subunit